jgi:hypothetical protein
MMARGHHRSRFLYNEKQKRRHFNHTFVSHEVDDVEITRGITMRDKILNPLKLLYKYEESTTISLYRKHKTGTIISNVNKAVTSSQQFNLIRQIYVDTSLSP